MRDFPCIEQDTDNPYPVLSKPVHIEISIGSQHTPHNQEQQQEQQEEEKEEHQEEQQQYQQQYQQQDQEQDQQHEQEEVEDPASINYDLEQRRMHIMQRGTKTCFVGVLKIVCLSICASFFYFVLRLFI